MKRIKLDQFSDYDFRLEYHRRFIPVLLIKNIAFLYPKPLYIVTLWILALLCLFKPQVLIIFFPLLVLYFYQKILINKLRRGLKVKRDYPLKSLENQNESFTYYLSNPYPHEFSNLILQDKFLGHKNQLGETLSQFYMERFPSHQRLKYKLDLEMNNGMGQKEIGPLTTSFTDFFGLHTMFYSEKRDERVQVFPKIYKSPLQKTTPQIHSIEYGLFDTLTRGENVNFFSTREYRQGDSIKHINWKLSLKGQKLIVNEFENNSNSLIDILFIDDQRLHLGEGRDSTFEYCKDLVLSLCQSQLNSHNRVGFHSYQYSIKPSAGVSHLNALSLLLSKLELKAFNAHELYHKHNTLPTEVIAFHKKLKHSISDQSNLYIFTGLISGKLWRYYKEILETFTLHCHQVHLVVVTGLNYLVKSAQDDELIWLKHLKALEPGEIKDLKEFCLKKNIKLSLHDIDDKVDYKKRMKNGFN